MTEPDLGALTYEALVELLERLTHQMESGEVGIEEAARLYEQAGLVHAAALERLEAVSSRLEAMGAGRAPFAPRDDPDRLLERPTGA